MVRDLPEGYEITMLNDQHAYLKCPEDSPLCPGNLVGLGISHPCTTFDKWDVLCVLDERFDVIDAVKTFFSCDATIRVVGIDDWSWRRSWRYGHDDRRPGAPFGCEYP